MSRAKLIHLTDLHITLPGDLVRERDPLDNLASAITYINAAHGDADACLITGDLTNWGEVGAYERLKNALAELTVPRQLLIGNHDDRLNFLQVFDDCALDGDGYVQGSFDIGPWRLLLLDTNEPGTHAGHYGADRRRWLEWQLERALADHMRVLMFMHHNPCITGLDAVDAIGLVDQAGFADLIGGFRTTIDHIFFGHCHMPLSGIVRGIPFTGLRACAAHQGWPDFHDPELLTGSMQPSMLGVILAEDDNLTVHHVEFAYDGPINKETIAYEAWQK